MDIRQTNCPKRHKVGTWGVLGGQTIKGQGKLLNGWTDWHQLWFTSADSSGNGYRLNASRPSIPPRGHAERGGGVRGSQIQMSWGSSQKPGDIAGTSTPDALVAMTHRWYEATDILNTYVRVVMLDFSKAFDLINHHILLEKLTNSGLPRHIVRWIGAFLLGRRQKVMIGSNCSRSGIPNGGVPQGTFSGPKCFLLYVNDLESNVPLYKYVDESTLFEICNTTDVSVMQESIDRAVNWTNNNCMKIK